MQKIKPIFALLVLVTGIIGSPNLAFAQVQLSAEDDAYSVDEDTTLTVGPIGVLLNDTNTGSPTFIAIIMTDAGFGTLTLNEDGSFTYTPFENFAAVDTFTYVANNGTDNSNEATVTIAVNPVNDPPNAEDDEYTTGEDTTLAIGAPGVLTNDTDTEVDSLIASLDSPPSHGDVTLNADGSFEYIPDTDFEGSDSFTYHANDGTEDSNIATVTINVNSVNDSPVANNDEYSTDEDTTLMVAASGVLDNDTDPENDSLTALLDASTSHGFLTLNADGSFDYLPDTDFNGTDSFTYHANDGNNDSNIAIVTINVNPKDPDSGDSILDEILEQLQMIFDKIFDLENEVTHLREENAALESRVTELETIIQNGSPHNDDDDDDEMDAKKQLKKEIKALKKEFKEQKKQLKNEYKEKEKELKKQIKDLKKDKKSDDDDDEHEDDDDDDDD